MKRSALEVSSIQGIDTQGDFVKVQVTPDGSRTTNPAADVTPNKMIGGLITEQGVSAASEEALCEMFPVR